MLLGTQKKNEQKHLEIGGCDTINLAAEFGTPLYVMDEECLREKCRRLKTAFNERCKNSLILYAAKSCLNMAICKIMEDEQLGLDISSGGEAYTALKAGFPMEKTYLHGNNKSLWEIELALDSGVGKIVLDNEQEAELVDKIAKSKNKVQDVMLRITPGIKPATHSYIQTGQIDTKFGLGISTGRAIEGIKKIISCSNLNLVGLHCHIGSNIIALESFAMTAKIMVRFMAEVKDTLNITFDELDLGGGLGVRYTSDITPPTPEEFAEYVLNALNDELIKYEMPSPKLLFEPGRYISGESGTTLYTIGTIKEVPGIKTYITVDGGLSDNPRPGLYDAVYEALYANDMTAAMNKKVTVAGKHCESDNLIFDIMLPDTIKSGDILAVQTTGAYNYAMASNYNRFMRPAMILVKDGKADLIIKRETLDDIISNDIVPDKLK